ncbi:MAG: acetate--CoA ligase family protein [Salinarimonas sp.]
MATPAPTPAEDADTLRKAIVAPSGVALIGASADLTKTTARPLRYLNRHGYAGLIAPINPGRDQIDGLKAWPSLMEAPDGLSHAFVMCRADDVQDVVRQCGARGITVATILSDGFAEAGPEGAARQAAVAAEARRAGVRLIGPNSIGVIDTDGFACSANAALDIEDLPKGPYAVVSQSGSMIGALISQGAARGIGFSSLVSIGNEIDLTVGEIGNLLIDDPRSKAILLFLESIKDRASLASFARRAHAAGKPVIAYKLGRSEAGRELAATHTGALAGGDDMVDALFAHLGIARVTMLESLIEAPPLFLGTRPAAGRRVAVVTTTGGGGAMVVDCLGALGIDIMPAPEAVRTTLREAGIDSGAHGLIDLTLAGTRPELVEKTIAGLMDCDEIDAVAMVIGSSAQFHPDLAVAPLTGFAGSEKPLAVYLVPAADESRLRLTRAGIAAFRTPESCAESLRAYLTRKPPAMDAPAPDAVSGEAGMAIVANLVASSDADQLDEIEGRAVMEALGIPGPDGMLATDAKESAQAFTRLGGPCVAKIVSPDITHKTDIGGVVLDITSESDAADAFTLITEKVRAARPDARIKGVLIQRMEQGVAEAIIGFQRDPALGPMVMLGAGGVFAEIYRDTTLRVAPVDLDTAREMLAEVVGLEAARGFRGKPAGDLDALAQALVALSQLARNNMIAAAEINPLLVMQEERGVRALDAVVVKVGSASGD